MVLCISVCVCQSVCLSVYLQDSLQRCMRVCGDFQEYTRLYLCSLKTRNYEYFRIFPAFDLYLHYCKVFF